MEEKNLFDPILLFLTAMTIWLWVLSAPPARSEEAPPQRMEDIPYCWAAHYGFYLPCMYSEKVVEA